MFDINSSIPAAIENKRLFRNISIETKKAFTKSYISCYIDLINEIEIERLQIDLSSIIEIEPYLTTNNMKIYMKKLKEIIISELSKRWTKNNDVLR